MRNKPGWHQDDCHDGHKVYFERRRRTRPLVVAPEVLLVVAKAVFDIVDQLLSDFRATRVVASAVVAFVLQGPVWGDDQELCTRIQAMHDN